MGWGWELQAQTLKINMVKLYRKESLSYVSPKAFLRQNSSPKSSQEMTIGRYGQSKHGNRVILRPELRVTSKLRDLLGLTLNQPNGLSCLSVSMLGVVMSASWCHAVRHFHEDAPETAEKEQRRYVHSKLYSVLTKACMANGRITDGSISIVPKSMDGLGVYDLDHLEGLGILASWTHAFGSRPCLSIWVLVALVRNKKLWNNYPSIRKSTTQVVLSGWFEPSVCEISSIVPVYMFSWWKQQRLWCWIALLVCYPHTTFYPYPWHFGTRRVPTNQHSGVKKIYAWYKLKDQNEYSHDTTERCGVIVSSSLILS